MRFFRGCSSLGLKRASLYSLRSDYFKAILRPFWGYIEAVSNWKYSFVCYPEMCTERIIFSAVEFKIQCVLSWRGAALFFWRNPFKVYFSRYFLHFWHFSLFCFLRSEAVAFLIFWGRYFNILLLLRSSLDVFSFISNLL